MEKECSHLIDLFQLQQIKDNIYANNEIVLCITGIGKVNGAMNTQYCLCKYNIDIVFNYGFAGSMTDKFKCGDLVMPKYILQHDFDLTCDGFKIGEVQGQKVSYIPNFKDVFSASKEAVSYIKEADYLLSGDKFMTERLEGFGDAVCDMEGYGVARAANNSNIPVAILKLITDSCNKEGQEEYYKSINEYKEKMQETLYNFIKRN